MFARWHVICRISYIHTRLPFFLKFINTKMEDPTLKVGLPDFFTCSCMGLLNSIILRLSSASPVKSSSPSFFVFLAWRAVSLKHWIKALSLHNPWDGFRTGSIITESLVNLRDTKTHESRYWILTKTPA